MRRKSSISDSTCLVLNDVIHICFNCLVDLFLQACLNHALVGGANVFEPERHSVEAERPVGGNECSCRMVGLLHLDLMASGVCVEETQ